MPRVHIVNCMQRFCFLLSGLSVKSGTSMNILPPGGSVYTVLLVSVQFSEKCIHIDLYYKGIWNNKPTHAPSVSNSC